MTTAPTMTVRSALVAVLRSRRSRIMIPLSLAWIGFWVWVELRDQEKTAAVSYAVFGIVLVAVVVHLNVRDKRGLQGMHQLLPVFVAGGMLAIFLVVNAVEPVIGARQMLLSAVGSGVIFAVVGYLESWVRRGRGRSPGSATAGNETA